MLATLNRPERAPRYVGDQRTTAPDNSVFLATVKSHLKIEVADEDTLLQVYIDAAVTYIEKQTRRSLLTQSWTVVYDSLPNATYLELSRGPLQSVTTFTTYDDADAATTTFADYNVDTLGDRLALKDGYSWPTDIRNRAGVKIEYVTGYGGALADVPEDIVQAVLMLVGYWNSNRDLMCSVSTVSGSVMAPVNALIGSARRWRL
jgi:uncharacterized phiE125 gp8 family phage protein